MIIEQLEPRNIIGSSTSVLQVENVSGEVMLASQVTDIGPLERIRHAERYPFDVPEASYVFVGGMMRADSAVIADRTPVLALGSNASPAQLARKFGSSDHPIAVSLALLRGYAVVYSAHFSSYGSLPATLIASPDAAAYVFVTWLDDRQLERMHASEALGINYDYEMLEAIEVDVDGHGTLDRAAVYVSRAGALTLRGQAIRLAEVPTTNCVLPALTQPAMLRCAHRQLAPDLDYHHFMQQIVDDGEFRLQSSLRLRNPH